MNDLKRISILRTIKKEVPNAPVSLCLELADGWVGHEREAWYLSAALALLSEVIDMDTNGNIPKELILKFKDNKPVLWALDKIIGAHGGFSCGPVKGMKELREQITIESASQSFFKHILKQEPPDDK